MIGYDWLLSTRWHRLVFLYLTCGIIVNHLDAFGLAEVEVRHQVQPKGVLRRQAHMRPASTMVFLFLVELQGSNLMFPMPMMLVFAFIRYVKPL